MSKNKSYFHKNEIDEHTKTYFGNLEEEPTYGKKAKEDDTKGIEDEAVTRRKDEGKQ